MFLEIITPDKKLFSGDVKSVLLPGTSGTFGVLNKHASMISSLKKGKIKIIDEKTFFKIFIICVFNIKNIFYIKNK